MSSSVGVLDFFLIEANEYVGRLDGVLAASAPSGPDLDALARAARALRGSATMARQQGIANVASGLERVARALAVGELRWDAATSAALIAAVDDLRILLHGVRNWGPAEEERARARATELGGFAPARADRSTRTTPVAADGGAAFLAGETADLVRSLDQFVNMPGAQPLTAAIERVRALRGVADMRDLAPLPDVLEAIENALKSIELSGPSTVTDRQKALFAAAGALLRRASRDIAARGRPAADLPELAPFEAARSALADESGRADRIVPITQLFYDDDGPHVVTAAPHPPTTPNERFRLEVVSLAEHIRRLAAAAREHPAHRERIGRDLRNALRALGSAAHGFGEKPVARFAAEWSARGAPTDDTALAALDAAATLLANPATRPDELARGLERLAPSAIATPTAPAQTTSPAPAPARPAAATPARPAAPSPAPPAASPAASAIPTRAAVRTPTGRELHAFLQDGLAGFHELEERPLSTPVPLPDEDIVPIEQLLYRGRSALERAAELRQTLLQQNGAPPREAVQELFDLIDLALVE